MPISGTGIDIVEIRRIKKLMEKDDRLKNRIFSENEIRYCEKRREKYHHYAVRFAAKEAVWKALGEGGVGLRNIEIRNRLNGQPQVYLKGKRLDRLKILVSLTHSRDYAVAQAIVIK
jgi:holo-[acyl-carrier protein] synthase